MLYRNFRINFASKENCAFFRGYNMKSKNKKIFFDKSNVYQKNLSSICEIKRNENGTKYLLLKFDNNFKANSFYSSEPVNIFSKETLHQIMSIISCSNACKILIDCEPLRTISSTELKFILKLIKYSKKQVMLFNVCENIVSLLNLSGISKLITMYNDKQWPYYLH